MTVSQSAAADVADAIEELYRGHALSLTRFALLLVGAFLGLYRRWAGIRDDGSVLGYLRTSVLNGCRSVQRTRARRFRTVQHEPPAWAAEAAVVDREDRRELLTAVARYPGVSARYWRSGSSWGSVSRRSRGRCASAGAPSPRPPRAALAHQPESPRPWPADPAPGRRHRPVGTPARRHRGRPALHRHHRPQPSGALRGHRPGAAHHETQFLSPDGQTMYVVGGSRGTSSGYLTGLYAYDVATSTLLRTVQTWSRGDIRFYVATAGTGDVALVWAGDETDQVNLATGAFAPFRQLPEFLSGYRISSIAW